MKAGVTVNCPGCNALQEPDIKVDEQGAFEPGLVTLYYNCIKCRRTYAIIHYKPEEWDLIRKEQAKGRLKRRAQRRKQINASR